MCLCYRFPAHNSVSTDDVDADIADIESIRTKQFYHALYKRVTIASSILSEVNKFIEGFMLGSYEYSQNIQNKAKISSFTDDKRTPFYLDTSSCVGLSFSVV